MITPWYKQFWPWFLITVPIISFAVGGLMFHLASDTTDSLVVDDYYKEGKAINARLDKLEQARKLNITSDLKIHNDTIILEFHSGIPREGEALKLTFYHVTLKEKDTSVLLTRDASGLYRGTIDQPLEGKWHVTLTPLDESWKIQQSVTLPRADTIKFNP
ncbi:FixH family protein [Alteromonas pelagimontana]|uniref:FixH family protein n=1 Tax=Alteromonas pelagimontana TaxID=1858656 RepID=A0A6M4MJ80_9ALTE|nr:FixH family protein [Alteromonas pelagimontana]QJR79302.1 FixH family protein [Alteromonas pelagimontana]QJR82660.1 FixH family protein [Alteromonas pelagimontana]